MRLDRQNSGFVAPKDILNFLRDNGMAMGRTEADCYFLVKFFDSDLDGLLHFPDFQQILLPCCDIPLRQKTVKRRPQVIKQGDYLTLDVEKELAELFLMEMDFHREVEQIKQELVSIKEYDKDSIFSVVDSTGLGHIYAKSIEQFLKNIKRKLTDEEIGALIRRVDMDGDNKISKQEFMEAILPQEPFSKMLVRSRMQQQGAVKAPAVPARTGSQKRSSSRKSSVPRIQKSMSLSALQTQALDHAVGLSSRSPLKFRNDDLDVVEDQSLKLS